MLIPWQDRFEKDMLMQGLEDYQDGVVTGLKKRPFGFEATVAETELRTVEIHAQNGVIATMGCSCKSGKTIGMCRHMVAVLLTLDEMLPQPLSFEVPAKGTDQTLSLTLSSSDYSKLLIQAKNKGMSIEDLVLETLKPFLR